MAGTGNDGGDVGSKDFKLGTIVLGGIAALAIALAILGSGSDDDDADNAADTAGAAVSTEEAAEAADEAVASETVDAAEIAADTKDLRARLEGGGFEVKDVKVGGTQASLQVPVEGDGRITAHVLGTEAAVQAFVAKLGGLKSNPTFKGGALVEPVGTNVYVGKFPEQSPANQETFDEVVAAGGGTA